MPLVPLDRPAEMEFNLFPQMSADCGREFSIDGYTPFDPEDLARARDARLGNER
jgi:hypothetical protein